MSPHCSLFFFLLLHAKEKKKKNLNPSHMSTIDTGNENQHFGPDAHKGKRRVFLIYMYLNLRRNQNVSDAFLACSEMV
jgi:hypothetical protein